MTLPAPYDSDRFWLEWCTNPDHRPQSSPSAVACKFCGTDHSQGKVHGCIRSGGGGRRGSVCQKCTLRYLGEESLVAFLLERAIPS